MKFGRNGFNKMALLILHTEISPEVPATVGDTWK